jgi:hypothetical protein
MLEGTVIILTEAATIEKDRFSAFERAIGP